MKRGSMTKPISAKQRQEMNNDPFYSKCCIKKDCSGDIQWHHNLKYGGKRQNVGILPVCEKHHREESSIKGALDWIMLNRMSDSELTMYSKAENLYNKRERLNQVYGTYNQG